MTNAELADEMEDLVTFSLGYEGTPGQKEALDAEDYFKFHLANWFRSRKEQIIAALRRSEPRIGDAKMADLLVETIWKKCVGQCLGENCGRLFISRERYDEHIAPLLSERQPSSDKVLVPREPTRAMVDALNKWAQCEGYIEEGYRAMLAAAESRSK